MNEPGLAVVIPSCGRPRLLSRCLDALAAQAPGAPAYELIVVDDGHDERTRERVEAFDAAPVRYLRTPRARGGPAAARNLGWRATRAPVIAFTDDDTRPMPDWLAQGLQAIEAGIGIAAVAGRVQVPLPARPRDHERDTAGLSSAEFVTANCFVRRSALERVGGFDERFRLAWREDSDLQFSLLEAGLRVVTAPTAVVCHPVRPARWGESLRQQRKVFFDALLFKKHPRTYRARVRSRPRWDYYAIVSLLLVGLIGLVAGWTLVAVPALAVWATLTAIMLGRRLRGASLAPSHIAEMLVTSIAIPPAAVFWRLRGALHFRVPFV